MKSIVPLSFLCLLVGAAEAAAQPSQIIAQGQGNAPVMDTSPQLIVNRDQWVVQVPPNSPLPRSIVLQLGSPTSAPSPTVILQQPPVGQNQVQEGETYAAGTEVYVESAPPPPRTEIIPVAPDHFHVWIGGHYEWRHHGYVWIPGRYERPPHRDARWVAPRWEMRGGRYFYIEGRWR